MTSRPHVFNGCWCGADHENDPMIRGDGDDPRVRPSDSRAESQAGSNGPSGSLNPSPRRAPGRMEQDEFNSRADAGEDPYSIVADDRARSAPPRRERLRRAVEDGERLYRKRMHDSDGPGLCIAEEYRLDGILSLDLVDALGLVDELLTENARLWTAIRIREESQIPVIPHGAAVQLERLHDLRDAAVHVRAVLRGMLSDGNVTRSIDLTPGIEMLTEALGDG